MKFLRVMTFEVSPLVFALSIGVLPVSSARAEEFGYNCPAGCRPGFVWRMANKDDLVCVLPEAKKRARDEKALMDERRLHAPRPSPDPNRPILLTDDCKLGFEWRQAYAGDKICADPNERIRVSEENRYSRAACSASFCQQWTVSGHLPIVQSNGVKIHLSLTQTGVVNAEGNQNNAYGSAYYESGGHYFRGLLEGHLNHDKFSASVQWENATRGHYRADVTQNVWVGQQGQVHLVGELSNGRTYDEQHPLRPEATWTTEGLLTCHRYGP